MTLAELISIRNFLTKLVVRGPEEDQLILLVHKLNGLIEDLTSRSAA